MIELKGVNAGYGTGRGKKVRLENADVTFAKGKMTVIVGPNGSGKSTMVKSVVGLCNVYSGSVRIAGTDVKELGSQKIARLISYLPQNRNLPAITAQKMVLHGRFPYQSYPRHYTEDDKRRVRESMEKLGIWGLRHEYVANLSGGERQKVYLAMALAGDTDGFLLDEPTTYLDICYQGELMKLLAGLKEEGKTVAVILHDLNAALQFADQVVVMQGGRVAAADTPGRIYDSGILEEVFRIKSRCFKDENGKNYYYFG